MLSSYFNELYKYGNLGVKFKLRQKSSTKVYSQ